MNSLDLRAESAPNGNPYAKAAKRFSALACCCLACATLQAIDVRPGDVFTTNFRIDTDSEDLEAARHSTFDTFAIDGPDPLVLGTDRQLWRFRLSSGALTPLGDTGDPTTLGEPRSFISLGPDNTLTFLNAPEPDSDTDADAEVVVHDLATGEQRRFANAELRISGLRQRPGRQCSGRRRRPGGHLHQRRGLDHGCRAATVANPGGLPFLTSASAG